MAATAKSYQAVIASPVGTLGLRLAHGQVQGINFVSSRTLLRAPRDPAARVVVSQLRRYFRDSDADLDIPLDLIGTPYQRRVWRALQRIPVGKVLTYGQLAARLDSGPRAVGAACRANPVPIIVPCHRVVAANGMGGFMGRRSGKAMDIKTWLLAHEGGEK